MSADEWFCEAHRLWTGNDCPECDAEQIRDLEAAALPKCHKCGCQFAEGDNAWASDWKVIDTSGTDVAIRTETRYTCDDCEANK